MLIKNDYFFKTPTKVEVLKCEESFVISFKKSNNFPSLLSFNKLSILL